jgi:tripartite-type tricarboxylate transporter receptor subunit TctC
MQRGERLMPHNGLPRRALLAAAGATLALPALTLPALAQRFPDRPLRLVVGYPPGGSNDVTARILAPRLQELLGQPVIVENRPGANATLGSDHVVRAAPDGTTVLLASSAPLAIMPATSSKVPYDTLRDLQIITGVAATPEVVAVGPSVTARDMREFLAIAQRGQLNIASSGSGGMAHLAIEQLRRDFGQNVVHVPYRGGGPAVVDTLSGNVHAVIVDLSALFGQIRDGKLRALVVTDQVRSALLPDVPSSPEAGVPNMQAVNWIVTAVPKATPGPVVQALHAAFHRIASSDEVKERYRAVGMEPLVHASPEVAQDFMRAEVERWGRIARESGARAEDG